MSFYQTIRSGLLASAENGTYLLLETYRRRESICSRRRKGLFCEHCLLDSIVILNARNEQEPTGKGVGGEAVLAGSNN